MPREYSQAGVDYTKLEELPYCSDQRITSYRECTCVTKLQIVQSGSQKLNLFSDSTKRGAPSWFS